MQLVLIISVQWQPFGKQQNIHNVHCAHRPQMITQTDRHSMPQATSATRQSTQATPVTGNPPRQRRPQGNPPRQRRPQAIHPGNAGNRQSTWVTLPGNTTCIHSFAITSPNKATNEFQLRLKILFSYGITTIEMLGRKCTIKHPGNAHFSLPHQKEKSQIFKEEISCLR